MPPIPEACQGLSDEVTALEATDASLRGKLATLVGADAWAALVQSGQNRIDLEQKRSDLSTCVRQHSAAVQANFVLMDLRPSANEANRVATLWQVGQSGLAQLETTPISSNLFSFKGPLPPQFAITILTTGEGEVGGPDFRSSTLVLSEVGTTPVRVEVVLSPQVHIQAADLSRLIASSFSRIDKHIDTGGIFSADLSVLTADATLKPGGVEVQVTGQIEVHQPLSPSQINPFIASATLSIAPTATPASMDIFEVIRVSEAKIEVTGNTLFAAVLSSVRGFVTDLLVAQLQNAIGHQLSAAISRRLLLATMPEGVTLSLRKLQIDPTSITFQPALGAVGTALSTFRPPVIPPP